MDEAAVVSAASGLVGAFIGAWSSRQLEKRRDHRQGAALRQTIRSDIWRRITRYEKLADAGLLGITPGGVNWLSVAGELSNYVPPNLHARLNALYTQADIADAAYREMTDGIAANRVLGATFELRRWCQLAAIVMESWDRHGTRSWRARLWESLVGSEADEHTITAESTAIDADYAAADRRVKAKYPDLYDTDGRGMLKVANAAAEAHQRQHAERVRAAAEGREGGYER